MMIALVREATAHRNAGEERPGTCCNNVANVLCQNLQKLIPVSSTRQITR